MKKKLLFIIILFLSITEVIANEDLLVEGEKIAISKNQFITALQRLDEKTRSEFLKKERRVYKAVKNFYLTKVAISKAKESGLYHSKKMQALINKSVGDTILKEMYREYLAKELSKSNFIALAKDYYKGNKEKYKSEPQRDVSHILIDEKDNSKAKELAEELRSRIINNNEDINGLAEKFSSDPSVKENKGRLGFFTQSMMIKPFSESAFALTEIGEISPIIKTKYGYHILRLEGIKKEGVKPFEEIKEELLKEIEKDEIRRLNARFKAELLDEENIIVNHKAIKSLIN